MSKLRYKMREISKAKIFWESGSVPFSCWKNPGGSIRKNGKLTDHVSFCKSSFILFEEIGEKPCAEHHELN